MIAAFRQAGARVEEAHAPVFERWRDKSGRSPEMLIRLGLRLLMAELRLVPDVAIRLLRCQVLMTGYVGQLDMLVLAPIARLMGRPVIANPLVTLTDTLVEDRKLVPEGSSLARLIALIDRLALNLADVVIVDTDANGRYVQQRFGIPPDRIAVIPVGADEELFYPAEPQPRNDTLDVLFYGKFIPLHGIDTIVRAARIVENQDPDVRFELVGRGQEYERIRKLAGELGVSTIRWRDWVSFEELGDRIRRADIVLGIFDEGAKAGRVVPNKIHQALACGVATITRESDAICPLAGAGGTLTVPPGDAEALAAAILALRDRELRESVGRTGRRNWEAAASSAALAEAAGRVIERLRPKRQRGAARPG